MSKKHILMFVFPILAIFGILGVAKIYGSVNTEKVQGAQWQEDHAPEGTPLPQNDGPATSQEVTFQVIGGDARPLLLKSFLERNKSPMAPYSETLVSEADKNGFDYRLTTAIAMCESNAGLHMPTRDSYNAFGISVYTGRNWGAQFKNWNHAIGWVSQYIKQRYYDQGLNDLVDIGIRWAPPSADKDNSWARCVQSFIDKIF